MSFITSPGVIVPPLTAGGVAYGTGGQAKVNNAGTAGQVLTSAGAGVPIWAAAVGPATPSAEGILYGKTNNLTPFQTFLGYQAGNVTTGVRNTFLGYQAGLLTTSGTSNTVVGESALKNNVTGAQNVAIGVSALEVSTASNNVAIGRRAMLSSTSGASNTGVGTSALESHTTSDFNVALGSGAGNRVTTGASNVMVGASAGFPLTTGSNNICIGDSATASSASVSNENTWGNSSSTSNRFWGDMKMAGANAGTSGQVLTSAGAGVAPTWGVAASGLTLIATLTASTSASLTFTNTSLTSTYDNYLFVISSLRASTGNSALFLQTSTDNGSTFATTSGDYAYHWAAADVATAIWQNQASTTNTALKIGYLQNLSSVGSVPEASFNAEIYVLNPLKSADITQVVGQASAYGTSRSTTAFGGGSRTTAQANNAIKFFFDSGNIASGTIQIFGVQK